MAEYVFIQNYTKRGKLGISRVCFERIVQTIVNRMQGVKVLPNSNKYVFMFHKPVHCDIVNDKVQITIQVKISAGQKVNEICEKIQQEIAEELTTMTELVPFSIKVKVANIE